MVTKDKLSELLQTGEVTVTFTKKDDSVRVMRCTQFIDLIPAEKRPKLQDPAATAKAPHPTNMRVFDLTLNEWRSFNYTTVIDVNVDQHAGIDPLTKTMGAIVGIVALMLLYVGRS